MRIQIHSPHTGGFEKIAVKKVEYVQLPPGITLVIKRKGKKYKEEIFLAESHNLTLVVEK